MPFLRMSKRPVQLMAMTAAVMTQPRRNGGRGMKWPAKMLAAVTSAPVAMAPEQSCPMNTGQTTQLRGPGVRLSMSIMPSPVHTV